MATQTTYGARDHARAQDGTRAEAMPVVPAGDWPDPPCEAGHLVWAETVAGGNYTHRVLARGTEVRLTVAHLEVVRDGALRPVGHDLGDTDRVVRGEPRQLLALGDLARQLGDPLQAEIPHGRVVGSLAALAHGVRSLPEHGAHAV